MEQLLIYIQAKLPHTHVLRCFHIQSGMEPEEYRVHLPDDPQERISILNRITGPDSDFCDVEPIAL